MKKIILLSTVILNLIAISANALNDPLFLNQDQRKISVNNRILAKVNGKAISVLDLIKKMDLLFYRQYPQYSSSLDARFQYYQMSWKSVLQQMIDKELIMADAEEMQLVVNNGDVRQEMEETFGPNIISNLDKANLTYEEASQMIRDDLILRRMMFFRVNSKAIKSVTPQDIRDAFEEYSKDNVYPDTWFYTVISIRGRDPTKVAEAANLAYRFLEEDKVPLAEIAEKIKTVHPIGNTVQVTVSENFQHFEKDLSSNYKEVLESLHNDEYSLPIAQKSRKANESIFRIFYLKEFSQGGVPLFAQIENKLKDHLIDKAVEKDTHAYIERLRKHYHVQELLLQDLDTKEYEPFRLK